jgi:coproporphyrinogen III oxidase-like Fe-S oxidoreductase
LDGEALLRERIMLGLRIAEGFDLGAAAEDLGVEAWPAERKKAADRLESQKRLTVRGGHLQMPRAAWLWADDVAARLF